VWCVPLPWYCACSETMHRYARVQARSPSLQLGSASRALIPAINHKLVGKVIASQLSRNAPCRQHRSLTASVIAAASRHGVEEPLDDERDGEQHEYEDDEEPMPTPPLPASALELLSQVLTELPADGAPSSPESREAPPGNAAAAAAAYQPRSFCVNCCRPLPHPPPRAAASTSASSATGAAVRCSGCGHDSSRDAEVLGDPHAWVEAYQQQLAGQEQQQQQGQQQESQSTVSSSSSSSRGSDGGGVLLAADARMMLHRSSLPPYPGRPERLQAIMSRLHSRGLLPRCRLLPCRPATDAELLAVHSRELVDAVHSMGTSSSSSSGGSSSGNLNAELIASIAASSSSSTTSDASFISSAMSPSAGSSTVPSSSSSPPSPLAPDTLYNAHTSTAALLAAGAAAEVGAALASGRAARALAVVRPPGAQAGVDIARGGCYLNNVAVAAAAALANGAQRVLIVDWDVHHGRGTQEIFEEDPRVLVLSMHRYEEDVYPGTGSVEEVGEGPGEGATLNIAFPAAETRDGLSDGDLLSAALHVVLPVGLQFRPQVVLVAAGFGALKGDPVGGCSCSPAVFA
ncbi:hypothetical protein Agub_g2146, partial [Astrephomene gubernaculifera]